MTSFLKFLFFLPSLLLSNAGDPLALMRLGPLKVYKDFVTMSGHSSGGTFAQQMYFSHSSKIAGIGVFSHSYYRCGPGDGVLANYDASCTILSRRGRNKEWDPKYALADIHHYAKSGLIDDPYENMLGKPLFVFAGTKNYLFTKDMSLKILNVFSPFVNNPKAFGVNVANANLTMPSNRIDLDLPKCEGPTNRLQVSNCGKSGAYEMLSFLLGPHAVTVQPPNTKHYKLQPLLQFDQTEFFPGLEDSSSSEEDSYEDGWRHDMDTVGYLYIPSNCKGKHASKCFLHFYFHGCSTGREFVGPNHIAKSGFLEAAEANGIIMIFPQAVSSHENEIGCWDTFGVTGKLYATKAGAQVSIVNKMMQRVLSN